MEVLYIQKMKVLLYNQVYSTKILIFRPEASGSVVLYSIASNRVIVYSEKMDFVYCFISIHKAILWSLVALM
jgi:hypothetical protein